MRARRGLTGALLAATALAVFAPAPASAADQWVFGPAAARPNEPGPGRHVYNVPEAPGSPACTLHFCVHWVAVGIDAPEAVNANGNGIPDFVEQVESVAEHVYSIENGKLGWQPPLSDGRLGGAVGKTDVYLKDLSGRLFGYAAPDRGFAEGAPRVARLDGYLVLDNDFNAFKFPHTNQLNDLEVTFAHEYNHVLQFGYDAYEDGWFAEATAVWMEDQVYPEIDDYLRYMRRWAHLLDTPLTANSIREYGSAVWNEWLTRHYGPSVVREAWARAIHAKPAGFAVAAYDAAIRAAGGPGFDLDFARFARDVAEWRTSGIFREGPQYPDVPRRGSVPGDGRTLRLRLNHATFRLLRVHDRAGRVLLVTATAPRGVAAGVALVGRIGGGRGARVVSGLAFRPHGGEMTVRLARPRRFQRITAVLVNADTRENGFSARRFDWNYLTESAPFAVRERVVR